MSTVATDVALGNAVEGTSEFSAETPELDLTGILARIKEIGALPETPETKAELQGLHNAKSKIQNQIGVDIDRETARLLTQLDSQNERSARVATIGLDMYRALAGKLKFSKEAKANTEILAKDGSQAVVDESQFFHEAAVYACSLAESFANKAKTPECRGRMEVAIFGGFATVKKGNQLAAGVALKSMK